MAAPKTIKDMPFIFTDATGKAEPAKRKLIRKYVMLGKNLGKTRGVKRIETANTYDSQGSNEDQDGALGLLIKMRYSMIPYKIGSEFSFTQFAAAVEPPLLHDILKFTFIAKKVMYPLESCIAFHRKAKVDTAWFELLTSDAAYMHAAVFVSQTYIALTSARQSPVAARNAIVHHSAALRLLRERLSVQNRDDTVSDPTVMVILFLALHAHFMNDLITAKHHIEGLRKIVDMKGGFIAFSHNTKLIIELLKCDLGLALNNGTEPIFVRHLSSGPLMQYNPEPLVTEESESSSTRIDWKPVQLVNNTDLVQAWAFLKGFCVSVNSAVVHKRQLPKEALLTAMASIMYRLLRVNNFDSTSIDEAVRVGLLVISSHIFLNWQDVKLPQVSLHSTYRNCLFNLKPPDTLPPQVLLWLLMIGSLSIFTPADYTWLMPRVRISIELCGLHKWSELREQLRAFPWVDFLHDKPGRALFDAAVSSQTDT